MPPVGPEAFEGDELDLGQDGKPSLQPMDPAALDGDEHPPTGIAPDELEKVRQDPVVRLAPGLAAGV